jgi:chemosensory pili system protein ChpA (sensor histidine kinase/response regulator)
MLSEQQQRILGYFIEEAKDHLNTIEQGLLNLQGTIEDPEAVSEVFRAAHSVKGGAAMLGLGSIQRTAHRLEDFFKVLKECPIRVDQQGENLFFDIFDGLKDLLEQLQGPFGLTDDKADEIMAGVEPKFTELGSHLNALVSAAGGAPPDDIELTEGGEKPAPVAAPAPKPAPKPVATEEVSAMQLVFQSDVPARLREMLQIFKQADTPESRQQLQDICQNLTQAGEQFDLPEWTELIGNTRRAIACPDNTYRALAPVVIKEVKSAQDLVLTGRTSEIAASSTLAEMVPAASEPEQEDMAGLEDLLSSIDLEDSNDTVELIDFDLDTGSEFADTGESDNLDWLTESADSNEAADSEIIADDSDLGLGAIDELDATPPMYRGEDLHPHPDSERHGPEVGTAELNSLADLFEGEVPELGATWEAEEVLTPDSQDMAEDIDSNNDFSDLLLEQEGIDDLALEEPGEDLSGLWQATNQGTNTDEDLSDLLNNVAILEEPSGDRDSDIEPAAGTPAESLDESLTEDFDLLDLGGDPETSSDALASLFDGIDSTPETSGTAAQVTDEELLGDLFAVDADTEPEADIALEAVSTETTQAPEEEDALDLGFDLDESQDEVTTSTSELDEWMEETSGQASGTEQSTTAVTEAPADNTDEEVSEEFNDLFGDDSSDTSDSSDSDDDWFTAAEEQVTGTAASADNDLGDWFGEASAQDVAVDEDVLAQLGDEVPTDLDMSDLFGDELVGDELGDTSASGDTLDLFAATDTETETETATGINITESLELPDDLFAVDFADTSDSEADQTADLSLDEVTASPAASEGFELLDENPLEELPASPTELDQTLSDLEATDVSEATSTEGDWGEGNEQDAPDLFETEETLDLDALLDGTPSSSMDALQDESAPSDLTDSFADLDSLLGEMPTSEPVSEPAGEGSEASVPGDEFADLEALLGDEESSDLEQSGTTVPEGSDDFADLEALLGDDPTPPPISPPQVSSEAKPATTSEFDDLEKLLEDADQLGGAPTGRSSRGAAVGGARRSSRRGVLAEQNMRVSVKNLDNLNNLVGELVVNRNSLEQAEERLRQFLDNLLYQVQQLSDVGQRMRDLYERSLLESSLLSSRKSYQQMASHHPHDGGNGGQNSHATGVSFDALEMDRFTGFHTLSQEMIELIVRVRESASDIDFVVDETDQVTRNFRQITTQLQEGLNRSRMVPFAQTADRLPRAVRDISLKCGKQAELVVEGRDTLIDKMILEQLYDPMTHLVNNAITHGIETPEERTAVGKDPVGAITIRTFYQGNQTVISISDDGAGIDPDKVKRKALEKGVITPAQADEMTRLDIYNLLFHSGFSTRDKADDFAGRGVGMDVVRTNLNEIRGAISIDSNIGQGTTFTIRLPLTLSISKALCCISNRARIAFPMDGVEDMLDVPKERIIKDNQDRPCIQWRDTMLPFHPLSELLRYNRSLGRGSVYGGNQEDDIVSVVVLRGAGNFLALQVDQVLGEQEIVIKQLEGPVPKPTGVAGATVQGDGRIMPIADVLELIDLSMGRMRRDVSSALWEKSEEEQPPADETTDMRSEPTVLIVDDSITVRELLSMTFNKVGYRVEQARDGQEAWEKLRSGLPCDLVFCDIEMPRMDGLELLSRIQKDSSLSQVPIAMLTSRGADRHRQMAIQLGAKGYFTKPYLEEALLDAAQRMLKGEVLVHSNAG